MKEIKFRAWIKTETSGFMIPNKESDCFMVSNGNGFAVYDENKNIIPNENVIILQFTGLYDKNGKEIYEGDVLDFINTYRGMNSKWKCTVEFLDGSFICRYIDEEKHYNHFTSWNYPDVNWKVIGNIYDNPELSEEV